MFSLTANGGAAETGHRARRRLRPWPVWVLVALAAVAPVRAQQPATLTLEEAIRIARQNNPQYRQTLNDESEADWGVREAYASFLPAVSASQGFTYFAAGTPTVGGVSGSDLGLDARPATYSSRYSLNASLTIDGQTFFNIARSRATQAQTEARIEAEGFNLDNAVTAQYLTAMGARDNVKIAQAALDAATQAYRLAEARHQAGAVTRIDLATAEVARGRAEIALIQAQNLYDTERVRLMQQLGIELDADVELTTTFDVFEPRWSAEELITRAMEQHPEMIAAKKAEAAANAEARANWTQYLPSLSFSGSLLSGNVSRQGDDAYVISQVRNRAQSQVASCEEGNALNARLSSPLPGWPKDCSQYAYTDAMGRAAVEANNQFPFHFTKSPMFLSVSISIPLFNGFSRERSLQAARARADDAKHARRAQELQLRTEITNNLLNLRAAWRTVELERKNAATAADALYLAQERYRLGAPEGSIVELTQAQEAKARADQSYLAAVYTFHQTLAALEAAVGTNLRESAGTGGQDGFESPSGER